MFLRSLVTRFYHFFNIHEHTQHVMKRVRAPAALHKPLSVATIRSWSFFYCTHPREKCDCVRWYKLLLFSTSEVFLLVFCGFENLSSALFLPKISFTPGKWLCNRHCFHNAGSKQILVCKPLLRIIQFIVHVRQAAEALLFDSNPIFIFIQTKYQLHTATRFSLTISKVTMKVRGYCVKGWQQ